MDQDKKEQELNSTPETRAPRPDEGHGFKIEKEPTQERKKNPDDFINCGICTGSTKNEELIRTAEMLVDIAERRGIYFAVAFLYDSSYGDQNNGRLKDLLPILQKTKGAIKKKE